VDTPVKFQVNFSAADAGDVDTHTLDYLSLDRISPVLDAAQIKHAANQVCICNERIKTTRNAWQSLACSPPGIAVSSPNE